MKTFVKILIFAIVFIVVVYGAATILNKKTSPQQSKVENTSTSVEKSSKSNSSTQSKVKELTTDMYDAEVTNAEQKVVIDFYTTWCGPCKIYYPIVEEVAEENENIKVFKVDIDKETKIADQFGITAIPTTIVIEKGEVKAKRLGALTKEKLVDLINY